MDTFSCTNPSRFCKNLISVSLSITPDLVVIRRFLAGMVEHHITVQKIKFFLVMILLCIDKAFCIPHVKTGFRGSIQGIFCVLVPQLRFCESFSRVILIRLYAEVHNDISVLEPEAFLAVYAIQRSF